MGSVPTDNGCANAGAVYLCSRSDSGWSFEAYIKAPNNYVNINEFGQSIAISGNTLVVGTIRQNSCSAGIVTSVDSIPTDGDCERCGAVYVYSRSDSGWSSLACVLFICGRYLYSPCAGGAFVRRACAHRCVFFTCCVVWSSRAAAKKKS